MRFNKSIASMLFFCFVGIYHSGCQMETDYLSYSDEKQKGKKEFLKDVKECQRFVDQNLKPGEGSEGAGERFNRKKSLFQHCMKDNHWAIKQ